MNQKANMNKEASKLLTKRIEVKLLSICTITGIAITIEAPSLDGYALEYENPLARAENFLKIAEFSNTELLKFEQSILSGLLLATWKHYELMECPLSSAAQNVSLQSIHPNTLISLYKFFAMKLTARNCSYLPKLSLQPKSIEEIQKSSITNVVNEYYKTCQEILFPAVEQKELQKINKELDTIYQFKQINKSREVAEAILRARRTKEATQKELLVTGRKLVKELTEEGILSTKLLSFLKILFTGDYLLTADLELKDRISKALRKHEGNLKAQSLVRIINDNATKNGLESIFANPQDGEIKENLAEVEASTEKKLTFAEKLALKIASKNKVEGTAEGEVQGTTISTIIMDEIALPTDIFPKQEEPEELEEEENESGGY